MRKRDKILLAIPFMLMLFWAYIRTVPVELKQVNGDIILTNIYYDYSIPSLLFIFLLFYSYGLLMYALLSKEKSVWDDIRRKKNDERQS